MRHWFHIEHQQDRGNFGAGTDEMLALFDAGDGHERQRWQTVFGLEPTLLDPITEQFAESADIPIILRAVPKSSSGWKSLLRR